MRNTQYTCDRCGETELKDVEDHLWNWLHLETDGKIKLFSEHFDGMDFCKPCSVDFQRWLFSERFEGKQLEAFEAFHESRDG